MSRPAESSRAPCTALTTPSCLCVGVSAGLPSQRGVVGVAPNIPVYRGQQNSLYSSGDFGKQSAPCMYKPSQGPSLLAGFFQSKTPSSSSIMVNDTPQQHYRIIILLVKNISSHRISSPLESGSQKFTHACLRASAHQQPSFQSRIRARALPRTRSQTTRDDYDGSG